jgi:hypothetical protein
MSGQTFTIVELRYDGSLQQYVEKANPIRFDWTAKKHTIPKGPWVFGIETRTVRDDYPGTDRPIEQILGTHLTEFTISGSWDDRWAGAGYAIESRAKMERLVRSCSPVQISFEGLTVEGLIKKAQFSYARDWFCGYELTFSPHFRPAEQKPKDKAAETAPARDYSEAIAAFMAEIEAEHAKLMAHYIATTIRATVNSAIISLREAVDTVSGVTVNRVLSIASESASNVKKLAGDLDAVTSRAKTLWDTVATAKTTTDLMFEQTLVDFNFEAWAKGIAALARAMAVEARAAAREMRRRAAPDMQALYRPRAGESLYAIANMFFGSPHAWRAIAERNGLSQMEFDGTELLVIPKG